MLDTEVVSAEALTRATRGAKWLDENFPGWEDRVDLDTLALYDSERCICGQVFADEAQSQDDGGDGFFYAASTLFTEANSWIEAIIKADELGPEKGSSQYADEVGRLLGFTCDDGFNGDVTYAQLQTAWTFLLTQRKS